MDRRKGTTKGGTTKRRPVIFIDLEHPFASNPRPYQVLVCRMITQTSNAWWLADPRSPRHHLTFAISNVRCLLSACEGGSSYGSTSSRSKIDHCLAGEIVEEATHANRLYHQKRLMRHRRRQLGKCQQWTYQFQWQRYRLYLCVADKERNCSGRHRSLGHHHSDGSREGSSATSYAAIAAIAAATAIGRR